MMSQAVPSSEKVDPKPAAKTDEEKPIMNSVLNFNQEELKVVEKKATNQIVVETISTITTQQFFAQMLQLASSLQQEVARLSKKMETIQVVSLS